MKNARLDRIKVTSTCSCGIKFVAWLHVLCNFVLVFVASINDGQQCTSCDERKTTLQAGADRADLCVCDPARLFVEHDGECVCGYAIQFGCFTPCPIQAHPPPRMSDRGTGTIKPSTNQATILARHVTKAITKTVMAPLLVT